MKRAAIVAATVAMSSAVSSPAAAIDGSEQYVRAIDCSATADFLAGVLSAVSDADPSTIETARNDKERWLQIALQMGEKSEDQVRQDRSEATQRLLISYFDSDLDGRGAVVEDVRTTMVDCQGLLRD